MADIQKLKLGSGNPDALMFSKYYAPVGNTGRYFTSLVATSSSFTENTDDGVWEVNENCEVEIVDSRTIKVKKFVIDNWFIRKKCTDSTELSSFASGFKVNIEGLSYLHSHVIKHTEGSDEADGFTNAYCGTGGYVVGWYPGQFTSGYYAKGFLIQGGMNYTANANECQRSLHMGRAPWDIGSYSQTQDGEVSVKAYAGIGARALTMGFFGGRQTATSWGDDSNGAYEVYDISDNPVYITFDVEDPDADIDPSSAECWDAYAGSEQVWHRDKTVENCWVKHGMATFDTVTVGTVTTDTVTVDMANIPSEITNPMLPEVIDWEEHILPPDSDIEDKGTGYIINWNCDLRNSPMQDIVKNYFANNPIYVDFSSPGTVNFYAIYTRLFYKCTVDGDFKVILGGNFPALAVYRGAFGITCDKLTIQVLGDGIWTSLNTAFYRSGFKELEVIDADGNAKSGFFRGTDLSGAFEFNSNLVEIPDNMISWAANRNAVTDEDNAALGTFFGYAFEYCSSLTRIGMYGTEREAEANTVRAFNLPQTFNGCTSLAYIGPVLDLSLVKFHKDGSTAYPYLAFNNCTVLEDVRIKNLNGSYVDFTGNTETAHGNLSALNQESVVYLFNNLTDLTTYDEYDHVEGEGSESFVYGRPYAESGELYCPSTWASYITNDMVSAANAKGWTIYIGGSEA